jgi:hypothetical protein
MKDNYLHLNSTGCWVDRELPAVILAKYALTIQFYVFMIYKLFSVYLVIFETSDWRQKLKR